MKASIAAALLIFTVGLAAAQSLDPVSSNILIDANGKILGPISFSVVNNVVRASARFRLSDDRTIVLTMRRVGGELTWETSDGAMFSTTNCSGPPMLFAADSVADALTAVTPDGWLWVSTPRRPPAPFVSYSSRYVNGQCQAASGTAAPATIFEIGVGQLNRIFAPPFTIGEYGRKRVAAQDQ